MKKKLRVSYSLLSLWERGLVDQAIDYYLKLGKFLPTPQQELGKKWHTDNETNILKEKKTLKEFANIKLDNPLPEYKVEVPYNNWFDLVGVFDCLDGETLYEWKTGNSSVSFHLGSKQLPLYFFIAKLVSIPITRAYLIRFNPITKETDWGMLWNSKKIEEEGQNYIDSLAPEIWSFFNKRGYLL